MSISKESIATLINLVEGSLVSAQRTGATIKESNLDQLRLCRYELLQEAVRTEQERFRNLRIPFSRRTRLFFLSESDKT
ncbi:MAG: hypothetical protein ACRCYZ_00785 [Alphaproteobacteria bacterium]